MLKLLVLSSIILGLFLCVLISSERGSLEAGLEDSLAYMGENKDVNKEADKKTDMAPKPSSQSYS